MLIGHLEHQAKKLGLFEYIFHFKKNICSRAEIFGQ